jgi:peptide-N4-(N-acetyl-beta-glucosaminyl)asparagine amidase
LLDGKWMYIDSTLKYPISFDHPHHYEQNWGKKYEYVLAFSADHLEDVTVRYTEHWDTVRKREREIKNTRLHEPTLPEFTRYKSVKKFPCY